MHTAGRWVFLLVTVLLTGCATRPTDPDELKIYQQNNDPLEPMNRAIFRFNMTADEYVLEPVARGYRQVAPDSVRSGVRHFFANLKQPVYGANALLQGDFESAWHITKRFAANTFWGFFGVFDTASHMDIPVIKRDFGQTLAVWGVHSGGPYLVLPFWGSSNLRDTAGLCVDYFLQPLDYLEEKWPVTITRWTLDGIQKRESALDLVDSVKKSSTDLYATMRTMTTQNRQKEINTVLGKPQTDIQLYDFDFPDDDSDEE